MNTTKYNPRLSWSSKLVVFLLSLILSAPFSRADYQAWSNCMANAYASYLAKYTTADTIKNDKSQTALDKRLLCEVQALLIYQTSLALCDTDYAIALEESQTAREQREQAIFDQLVIRKAAIDNMNISDEEKDIRKHEEDLIAAANVNASEATWAADNETALDNWQNCVCEAEATYSDDNADCQSEYEIDILAATTEFDNAVAAAWDTYNNVDVPACGPNPGT